MAQIKKYNVNKKLSLKNNNLSDNNYMYLKSMLYNIFIWENLPDNIPPQYVEQILIDENNEIILNYNNALVGAYMLDGKLTISHVVPSSSLNIYGEYYKYKPHYINGKTGDELTRDKIVLIYNNIMPININHKISYYSNLLNELDVVVRNNIKNQKKASIISAEEETLAEINRVLEAVNNGASQIVTLKSEDNIQNNITNLELAPEFIVDKYLVARQIIINNYLSAIGINNSGLEKKERKITSEVEATSEESQINLTNMLIPRLHAVKLINKKFGTNIKVNKFNSSYILNHIENTEDEAVKKDIEEENDK